MIHDDDLGSDGYPRIYVLEALAVTIGVQKILKNSARIREVNLVCYCDNQSVVTAFKN